MRVEITECVCEISCKRVRGCALNEGQLECLELQLMHGFLVAKQGQSFLRLFDLLAGKFSAVDSFALCHGNLDHLGRAFLVLAREEMGPASFIQMIGHRGR